MSSYRIVMPIGLAIGAVKVDDIVRFTITKQSSVTLPGLEKLVRGFSFDVDAIGKVDALGNLSPRVPAGAQALTVRVSEVISGDEFVTPTNGTPGLDWQQRFAEERMVGPDDLLPAATAKALLDLKATMVGKQIVVYTDQVTSIVPPAKYTPTYIAIKYKAGDSLVVPIHADLLNPSSPLGPVIVNPADFTAPVKRVRDYNLESPGVFPAYDQGIWYAVDSATSGERLVRQNQVTLAPVAVTPAEQTTQHETTQTTTTTQDTTQTTTSGTILGVEKKYIPLIAGAFAFIGAATFVAVKKLRKK